MKSRITNPTIKRAVWLFLILVLFMAVYWLTFQDFIYRLNGQTPFAHWILEGLTFGLLSFSICQFLNVGFGESKYHYRIAFISIIAIGLFLNAGSRIEEGYITFFHLIISLAIPGFAGSFVASNLSKGFWENNAPPPKKIESEVWTFHQDNMDPSIRKPAYNRFLNFSFALLSLLVSMPVWVCVIVLIWWEDPGPVFFVKNSVGKQGKNFKQLKFRSMIINAEKETGPISGYEVDERELFFGHFLRKTALDELPQLINILSGQMNYVGPRPQRTVLVHEYLQYLPQYVNRHRVKPGLSGLAQVADSYHISPEEKLAWDLKYIQVTNIWFDIKLMLLAFYLVFFLRFRPINEPERKIRKRLGIDKPEL